MRPRISITGSVRPSVRRSVGHAFVKNDENRHFEPYMYQSIEKVAWGRIIDRSVLFLWIIQIEHVRRRGVRRSESSQILLLRHLRLRRRGALQVQRARFRVRQLHRSQPRTETRLSVRTQHHRYRLLDNNGSVRSSLNLVPLFVLLVGPSPFSAIHFLNKWSIWMEQWELSVTGMRGWITKTRIEKSQASD